MSIWDVAKGIITSPFDIAKKEVDYLTGKGDTKKQQELMNEQIKAYKEQTELSKAELSRAKDEQIAEKRRIQEKQIRSLRRSSSSRGFLGTSNLDATNPAMSNTLGG